MTAFLLYLSEPVPSLVPGRELEAEDYLINHVSDGVCQHVGQVGGRTGCFFNVLKMYYLSYETNKLAAQTIENVNCLEINLIRYYLSSRDKFVNLHNL